MAGEYRFGDILSRMAPMFFWDFWERNLKNPNHSAAKTHLFETGCRSASKHYFCVFFSFPPFTDSSRSASKQRFWTKQQPFGYNRHFLDPFDPKMNFFSAFLGVTVLKAPSSAHKPDKSPPSPHPPLSRCSQDEKKLPFCIQTTFL